MNASYYNDMEEKGQWSSGGTTTKPKPKPKPKKTGKK